MLYESHSNKRTFNLSPRLSISFRKSNCTSINQLSMHPIGLEDMELSTPSRPHYQRKQGPSICRLPAAALTNAWRVCHDVNFQLTLSVSCARKFDLYAIQAIGIRSHQVLWPTDQIPLSGRALSSPTFRHVGRLFLVFRIAIRFAGHAIIIAPHP